MTIQKEEPGLWFAICDNCGDRIELDTDPDDPFTEAVAEVKQRGWRCNPPETVSYADGPGFARKMRTTYWTHSCGDCR